MGVIAITGRRFLQLTLWGWLWAFAHAPAASAAEHLRVIVVLSENNSLYQKFADTLRQNLPADIQIEVVERAEDFASKARSVDLILTVGARAAVFLVEKTATPILAAMLPKAKYAELIDRRPRASQTSAVYVDHAWGRQVDLLRTALPERSRVGVLHSPTTRLDINELRQQLTSRGATLIARQTSGSGSLFDDLEDILSRCDILLAVPDSEIYNSNNIRNILLSSYRHNIPLIGFSQAFVNAGALLALFSTPEQLAAQASSITISFAQSRRLPEPQHPMLYSIAVNPDVARTLGGAIKSAELLRLQIDKLPRTTP